MEPFFKVAPVIVDDIGSLFVRYGSEPMNSLGASVGSSGLLPHGGGFTCTPGLLWTLVVPALVTLQPSVHAGGPKARVAFACANRGRTPPHEDGC